MDAQTALKLPTSSATQRTAKLKALALASKIILDGEKSSCKVSGLIGWQQSINTTYKKWQQECDATQKSIESLGDELHAASSYMKSEHELAIILSAALGVTKDKVTEGHLSTVLTKWKTAESAVKAMGVSEEFNPVKVTAQKVVGDVAAAWQSLVTAHVAKDETKYEKALKTVASAYSAIDDIEKESTQQVTRLSKTVQSRYEAVF
jgi:uncharacterized protein (DUF342 family)